MRYEQFEASSDIDPRSGAVGHHRVREYIVKRRSLGRAGRGHRRRNREPEPHRCGSRAGGYYSELLAGVVGPRGRIVLQNNYGYAKWVDKYIKERYVDNNVPPIEVLRSEVPDLKLEPNAFDAVVMIMSYHDLYYYNPEAGFERVDVPDFFAQVTAALKPGGRLLIVDHAAPDGSGTSVTQEIHRIDPAFARADIESNGLRLIATSDVLRNPDDPRTMNVFAKDIRGKTDRFIMVFEK